MTISRVGRRWVLGLACAAAAAIVVAAVSRAVTPARSAYTPRDPWLRDLPLVFYPGDTTRPPRAVVFFFGNDVGFHDAHQRLSERLERDGYAVAGLDIKPILASLPDEPAARDSAFAAGIGPIIDRARRELRGDSLPLVIAGHSLGAEIALWTAAHVPEPGLRGVLALSPGSRSHLRVSLSDLLNSEEPHEPGSFAVADQVAALPPAVRVAVVRGGHDQYGSADPTLLAAGRGRAERFPVPFAGHALKRLFLAGLVVERAMDYLLAAPATAQTMGGAPGAER